MFRRDIQLNNLNVSSLSEDQTPKYTIEQWTKKLDLIEVNQEQLNELIMNYLVVEGFKDAAECFQKESGTKPAVELSSIENRLNIRLAIQRGEILNGIAKIVDLSVQTSDTNKDLMVKLKQQHLIELIREGDLNKILDYAQEELAEECAENPELLEELEKIMTLLAFEDQSKCPFNQLLSFEQRQKTASEVNAAILTFERQEKDAHIITLLKMLMLTQQKLGEKLKFPKLNLAGKFS
eukprot:TRINITY_DN351_c1_g1_i1.p1 TRINITY_DN351_c1_g1~~TRINITY_DN351_c1_g1_i1.p1  ORF type:complete len:249 (-),score=104.93 TRINITY_DN351_c1_g1_i1:637-1347(-)